MWGILVQAIVAAGSYLLPRLLAAIGVVAFSQTAVQPVLNWLQGKIVEQLSSTGEALQFLQYMGVQDAISIIFSAYAVLLGMTAAKAAFSKSASKGG
ncbi:MULTISPECIES: DUF2523 family protein [Pseudomonas]|uniref:DUF2523 family protein n=1 Tax=Pseudomonas nitroreducens TaxID=46680 RepID=UPI001E2CA29C|nr:MULTISPECIES: DUF2523 family protein [Pseudomonas]MCE4068535.1 DUF2523 domain-containing protein [Pseudomonas nitritireducens]MCE4077724.1 DUF2523 domain-containing protein [Pseudomonas nitroreducens]